MGSRSWSFLFLIFVLPGVLLSTLSYALPSVEQIVDHLDKHYYYPQKQGLNKLSVRMDWEQLDVATDSGRYLKNPQVKFSWENKGHRVKSAFRISDKAFEMSRTRKNQIVDILENYKAVVIPESLRKRVTEYEGEIKVFRKNKALVEFNSPDWKQTIRKYEFFVDLGRVFIRKLILHRANAPRRVQSELRYVQKDGKWLVAESRSEFEMDGVEYNETTEYVYRRINNFWLVGKMIQTVKDGDKIVQSYIFRFHDYQIN